MCSLLSLHPPFHVQPDSIGRTSQHAIESHMQSHMAEGAVIGRSKESVSVMQLVHLALTLTSKDL